MCVKDVAIAVMAVLNDSTGTLMSCAHKNHDCKIGVIIGKEENWMMKCDASRRNSVNDFSKLFLHGMCCL